MNQDSRARTDVPDMDEHVWLRPAGPVLLLESDPDDAMRFTEALERTLREESQPEQVDWANGLADLVLRDLSRHRLAFVSMELNDGTGMDALAYLLAIQPTIGVVIYASDCREAIIRETIMSGALDCLPRTARFADDLPSHVKMILARLEARGRSDVLRRKLADALGRMTDELGRLRRRVTQLESLSVTDELTGLYNRRFMNTALDELWRGTDRAERSLGCMVIDIDRFKDLNDRFGHQSGDAALYVLGEVLRENCRRSDVITRYGGDEFCILMPDISIEQAREIALRIEHAFRMAAAALLQSEFECGLSIGLSITTVSRPRSAMQLVAHADEAMYAAKRGGCAVRTRGPVGVLAA